MGFLTVSFRQSFAAVAMVALTAVAGFVPTIAHAQEQLQPSGGGAVAPSDVSEPVVVVTLASIQKLMEDVNYLSSVLGQPQAGGMFSMMAGSMTQGIDPSSPIAVLVPLVDGVPEPIAMVPTTDVRAVLKRLEAQTGPVDEQPDGTLVIAIGASTVYVRQAGNWAVLARNRALLDAAPADPSGLLTGLGNDYDLAVRLKMQLVPAQTREMLVAQLRQGFEQAMKSQNAGGADSNRDMAEATIKQIEQLIQETDELKLGWNIDKAGSQVTFDGSFTAVAGSQLAEMYSGQHSIPSSFASVIRDDAAAFYHAAASISPQMIEQTRSSVQTSISAVKNAIASEDKLTPEQAAEVQQMIDRIADLAVDSIAEGKADTGALLLADANKMQFVFGAFVSDGNEAAQIAKDIASKVEGEKDAPRFKFNVGTYKNVTMHAVEFDVPAKAAEVQKVFGETAVLHIGTAPKAVYVAVGKGSEELLKSFIDSGAADNGGSRPIAQMRVHMLPILQFIQSVKPNDAVSAMMDALSRTPDPGTVRMVSDSIPGGLESRVSVGEGMLKAIGAAINQAQMKRMQQNGR